MMTFLYQVFLGFLALISLPRMLYMRVRYDKYKNSFLQRFGKDFPTITKGDRFLVWIHAVSVGEARAIAALAKLIKNAFPDCLMIFSSITETGHAEAKRSLPFADYHVYLPFDFNCIVQRIIEQSPPDLLLFSETDFWYNFMNNAKKHGAKIAVANGKLSNRSLERFLMAPWFARRLFSLVDLFCVQTPIYKEHFERIGVLPAKVILTGNMKLDDEPVKLSAEELIAWKKDLGIDPQDTILVIGSSHDPEEKLLLDICLKIWPRFPNLKVLLVPRHPERFDEVEGLLQNREIPYVRYSHAGVRKGNEKVILVDTMGILKKCYQLADIALVAGSYTQRIGGHNVIEPCWFGKPVLFGPYMHTQADLVAFINHYHAGKQVPIEQLEAELCTLLSDPNARRMLSENGLRLTQGVRGSTEKTWQTLQMLLNE